VDESRARDLLGPYLLGGLSDEEERELEAHLASSPEDQRELAELREAHEFLSEPSHAPPPELKERILSQTGIASDGGASIHDPGVPESGSHHGRRRIRRIAAPLVAAGLIVAAFLLGGILSDEMPSPGGQNEAIALSPTGIVPESSGEVRVAGSGSNYEVELEVERLPEPPGDGFYELWFIGEEGRTSAGTFRTSPDGRATVRLSVPSNSRSYEKVGITYEPADGDPMPSGKKVLGGPLDADRIALRPAVT
jgi:hypothetical protein